MSSEDRSTIDRVEKAIRNRVERFEAELRRSYGNPPTRSLGDTEYDYVGSGPKHLTSEQKIENLIKSIESWGDE